MDQAFRPPNGTEGLKPPPGWQRYRLGDATTITSGITLGRNLQGRNSRLVPYLRVANVKDGFLDLRQIKHTPATEEEIDACQLEPGDILLTEGGDLDKLGRGTYWEGQIPVCIHQNHIFRIRSDPAVFDPAFLAFQFGSPYGKAYFLRHAKQTTGIASINKTVLSNFPLYAPPLAAQRRIAKALRQELAEVAKAQLALQIEVASVDALTRGLLQSLFCCAAEKSWPSRTIAETCDFLPAKSIALAGDAEVRAATSACLTETGFNAAGVKAARMWSRDVQASLLRPGEVLIARSNTPELVGRASRYAGQPEGVVASDLTIRLWPKEQFDGGFLALYLSYLYIGGYWRDRAGGASGSMKKITRSQIETQQIQVPALSEQRKIAGHFQAAAIEITTLRQALEKQRSELALLPTKLSSRFFTASNATQ